MNILSNNHNKILPFQWLFLGITVLYFWEVCGYRRISSQNQINYILLLLWLLFATILSPTVVAKVFTKSKYIYLYVFLLYVFINGALSYDISSVMKFMVGFIIIISPVFICDYIKLYDNSKVSKYAEIASLIIFAYYSFKTLSIIKVYPAITRELASPDSHISQFYYGTNIGGGFPLTYGLSFLIIFLAFYLLKVANKVKKLILIFYVCLFGYTLFKSQYFIATLLVIFGVILNSFNKNKQKIFFFFYILIILCLSLYLFGFFNFVGEFIIESTQSNNSVLGVKLNEIGYFLTGNNSNSYVNILGRTSRMKISLDTFLAHPIIGVGRITGFNTDIEIGLVGQHSEWIDSLARFGIIGSFIYFILLYKLFKDTYQVKLKLYSVLIIFIILGFADPIRNFTVFYVIYFVVEMMLHNGNKVIQNELKH